MQIALILVPYNCGDERHGSSKGADKLVQAGIDKILENKGHSVTIKRVERTAAFRDSASSSLEDCRETARLVNEAVFSDQFPLVLAGMCDVSKGVLSGFDHSGCGVIWIDAHGDFNTPETTVSGYFPGMSLALITGRCYKNYWAQIGNSTPISEAATLIIGVRDLDPLERDLLEHSEVRIVPWKEGAPQTSVTDALDRLAGGVRDVYVHIDLDAFDPSLAGGISDYPVPGGLSLKDMEDLFRETASRFRIRAATIATYNPGIDKDGKALKVVLGTLEMLVKYVNAP